MERMSNRWSTICDHMLFNQERTISRIVITGDLIGLVFMQQLKALFEQVNKWMEPTGNLQQTDEQHINTMQLIGMTILVLQDHFQFIFGISVLITQEDEIKKGVGAGLFSTCYKCVA